MTFLLGKAVYIIGRRLSRHARRANCCPDRAKPLRWEPSRSGLSRASPNRAERLRRDERNRGGSRLAARRGESVWLRLCLASVGGCRHCLWAKCLNHGSHGKCSERRWTGRFGRCRPALSRQNSAAQWVKAYERWPSWTNRKKFMLQCISFVWYYKKISLQRTIW